MRGDKRLFCNFQQILKSRIVEVGTIDDHSDLLHALDSSFTEIGQSAFGVWAGAQLVGTVPYKAAHLEAERSKVIDVIQILIETGSAFDGTKERPFVLGGDPLNISNLFHHLCKVRDLGNSIIHVVVLVIHKVLGSLSANMVRNKNRHCLDAAVTMLNILDVKLTVMMSKVLSVVPQLFDGITVQVKQFHYISSFQKANACLS